MNLRIRAAIASICVAVSSISLDAVAYTVGGSGIQSCGSWTANRAKGPSAPLFYTNSTWVLGFLSGVGYASPPHDPLHGLDAEAVLAWVDNYCGAYPLDNIATAAGAFVIAHPR